MPLSDKALLVTLSLSGGFSPTKTDKRISRKVNDQHNAKNGALRVSKRLLLDEAIDPIRKLHGEIREYHYTNTLPWGENERLLPSSCYLDYAAWMRQRRAEVDNAIDTFIRDYPQNVAAAREVLQSAFNPSDYPTSETIRGKFGFKLDYKPLPDAGDFRISIMREEMDQLREHLNSRVAEAEQEAVRDLARRMAKPLANMVNRLSDPDSNFHDTLVSNLREITDLIPRLNVTGDPEIEAVRQRIQSELCGVDASLLRDNQIVRTSTARKAQEVLSQLSDYMPIAA